MWIIYFWWSQIQRNFLSESVWWIQSESNKRIGEYMNLFNFSGWKSSAATIRRWCHSVDWLVFDRLNGAGFCSELHTFIKMFMNSTWMKCNFLKTWNQRGFFTEVSIKQITSNQLYLLLFKLISLTFEPKPLSLSVCVVYCRFRVHLLKATETSRTSLLPTWSCSHVTHMKPLHVQTHEEETVGGGV